jgi:hypothetical protein
MGTTSIHTHAAALPAGFVAEPEVAAVLDAPTPGPTTLIHLIYRAQSANSGAKDYDFARAAMLRHWESGVADVEGCIAHPGFEALDLDAPGMDVFDPAA